MSALSDLPFLITYLELCLLSTTGCLVWFSAICPSVWIWIAGPLSPFMFLVVFVACLLLVVVCLLLKVLGVLLIPVYVLSLFYREFALVCFFPPLGVAGFDSRVCLTVW